MSSTREKILDTAEECFAREGIASASIRTITSLAEVNLGAITYHFGSKDNLVVEVFKRRMGPLTQERIDLLTAAHDEVGDQPVPLRKVLEAIVLPQVKVVREHPQFIRFLVHMKHDPNDTFIQIFNNEFDHFYQQLRTALRAALPPMTDNEFFLKLHFMIHLMDFIPEQDFHLQQLLGGPLESEATISILLAFLEGGLKNLGPAANNADV